MLSILALLTTSAAFIFAYDYFTQSRQFEARHIAVDGQKRLSAERVLEIAGITPGCNILDLNLSVARKRLIADPWIADATVRRDIPSGLQVSIQEEDPLALLEMKDTSGFLVNRQGRVFKRADALDTGAWPRVQGLDRADLPVGELPDSRAFLGVKKLLLLTREKGSALPFAHIRQIRMDSQIGATVYMGETQRAIKLGFGHYREKLAALGELMTGMQADSRLADCQTIDLFNINRIVITLAPGDLADPALEEVNVAGT
ncbi:hypothetical protein JCM12296A_06600 [Desulfosarcina cetonica]|uniref:cell division protein FtsQ/DivIB n=1 Tax=Desulfosarcina cetonica TaxID=90730 RepID=UPI0006D02D25|nr:FtsQ-type POTRA domain-containing protein [Desulfosarcina cetonica]